MPTDILQKFLDGGLLDLGEDRERFGYIKSAAEDLAKSLLANRRELITASSVVMGGEISEDESVIKLSKGAVSKHWQTYGSRFPANAIQLFRATLLQALALITQEDSDTSNTAIIYYTTCGLLPHLATTREDEIFREFLTSLAERVEDQAATIWDLQTNPKPPTIQYKDAVSAAVAVDPKALKELLKNAIGPGGGTGANPHWPSSNSNEWLEHYSTNTANAISAAINSTTKELPKVVAQSRSDAQAALNALNEKLVVASENLRADVLYWKEALFSPSKKVSYRHLSHDGVIYWAAQDLQLRIPRFHPLSVEFFLRETVRSAIGDKEAKKKLTVEQFANAAASNIDSRLISAPDVDTHHRLTPLDAVEAVASKKLGADDASVRTGLPSQTAISRDELAVLLFRGFQVRRLAGSN